MKSYKHNTLIFVFSCMALALYAQTNPGAFAPVTVQVQNEAAVNTTGLEFSPTFYEDGIVFISTNTAGLKKLTDESLKLPAMSILRSQRNAEGALSTPEPFAKELSSLYHEGPVCFDRTAETVFFSRNALIDGKEKIAKDKAQKMRLYVSRKSGGLWSEPEPLPFNANEFDDCHPAISIDGDKLFFASNRPGGLGGMDLYVSYKVGESWSEPVNLGAGVNTAGNDAFPFIHADNTLYFASDGQADGKGGFDLYYAIPEGSVWTKPINMGDPFNTGSDDIGLIIDLNKINGYYSSNGAGGQGGDEIFSFHTENGNLDDYLLQGKRVPDRNLDLKIVVTDKGTGAPIKDAEVQILNYDGTNVIGRDEQGNLITVQTIDGKEVIGSMPPDKGINGVTDTKGRFGTDIKPGNYVIIITKKGYQTKQFRLPISKTGNELAAQLEKSSMAAGRIQWIPTVFNYNTNAPLSGATLILTDERTGIKDTLVTDVNGTLDHYINIKSKYKVDILQAGRVIGSTEVNTNGWPDTNKPMYQNISVAPLLPGSAIELPNIYYNYNDATLRPDARKDLDLVIALMKQQPNLKVELRSHTDCRGSDEYNQGLSQRRANGVVEYMVMLGISRNRLAPIGFGESELFNNCRDGVNCSDQEHARNRRTEVRMLANLSGASMVYVDGKISNNSPSTDEELTSANVNVKPQQNTESGKVKVSNASSDAYYVVAGSFLAEARANNHLASLQKLGHSSAEIIRFPNSNFFSVSVAKFKTREEASAFKRKLDQNKIDAFVRAVQ
ncbi:MAG: OmpA family protein [Saprospiraceae bacterium]|nr:OmpA family protein [Saprospiraceae bacterium]